MIPEPMTVAASNGRAVEEQARMMKRYAPEVWVAYDGDSPGQKATLRALEILETAGIPCRACCRSGDPATLLRAVAEEMQCDALLKGTSVDGIYDSDPKQNPNAKRYDSVDYDTVMAQNLKVMDASAVALCRDNGIPIVVFSIREKGNLARVLAGQGTQTIVSDI